MSTFCYCRKSAYKQPLAEAEPGASGPMGTMDAEGEPAPMALDRPEDAAYLDELRDLARRLNTFRLVSDGFTGHTQGMEAHHNAGNSRTRAAFTCQPEIREIEK